MNIYSRNYLSRLLQEMADTTVDTPEQLYHAVSTLVKAEDTAKGGTDEIVDAELEAFRLKLIEAARAFAPYERVILTTQEQTDAVQALMFDYDELADGAYQVLCEVDDGAAGTLLDSLIRIWEKMPMAPAAQIYERWVPACEDEFSYSEYRVRAAEALSVVRTRILREIGVFQRAFLTELEREAEREYIYCTPDSMAYEFGLERAQEIRTHLRILQITEPERMLTPNITLVPGSFMLLDCARISYRPNYAEVSSLTLPAAETAYKLWCEAKGKFESPYYHLEDAYAAAVALCA